MKFWVYSLALASTAIQGLSLNQNDSLAKLAESLQTLAEKEIKIPLSESGAVVSHPLQRPEKTDDIDILEYNNKLGEYVESLPVDEFLKQKGLFSDMIDGLRGAYARRIPPKFYDSGLELQQADWNLLQQFRRVSSQALDNPAVYKLGAYNEDYAEALRINWDLFDAIAPKPLPRW